VSAVPQPRPGGANPGGATPGGANLVGAARSGIISLAGSAVAAVAGLLLNVVIGRGLGPSASGVYFVAVAVLTVAATVSKLGADTGLVRELARVRSLGRGGDARRVLLVAVVPSVVTGALLAAAVHAAAGPLGSLVGAAVHGGATADGGTAAADLTRLLRQSAPYLLFGGPCLVLTAGLRGLGDVTGFAGVQNVLVPSLRTLSAGGALAAGLGLSGAMLGWNAPLVVGTALAAVLVVRRSRPPADPGAPPLTATPYPAVAGEFWRFSAPRSAAAVLEVAIVWADVVIVAALTSPREAGVYAAASRFVTTGTLAEAALRVAMAPQVSRLLAGNDLDGAGRLCAVATQWIVLLSWPLYLVLALYAPYVLALFGPGFAAGATALTLLSLAMIVVMSAGNNQTILLMSGRSGSQLRNKALALAVDLGLNLVLVPRPGRVTGWGMGWGMDGAAVAWALTVLLDATLVLTQVRRSVGVRIPMGRVWPAMALAGAAFVPLGVLTRVLPVVPRTGPGSALWTAPLAVSVVIFAVLLRRHRDRLDVEPLRQALPGGGRALPGGGRALTGRGKAVPGGRPAEPVEPAGPAGSPSGPVQDGHERGLDGLPGGRRR